MEFSEKYEVLEFKQRIYKSMREEKEATVRNAFPEERGYNVNFSEEAITDGEKKYFGKEDENEEEITLVCTIIRPKNMPLEAPEETYGFKVR